MADTLGPQKETLISNAKQTAFTVDLLEYLPEKELSQVDVVLQRRYRGLLLQEEKGRATLLPLKRHVSEQTCLAKMSAAEKALLDPKSF